MILDIGIYLDVYIKYQSNLKLEVFNRKGIPRGYKGDTLCFID
jgi:hypothetical protein